MREATDKLIGRARAAMREAKRRGGNRVVRADEADMAGLRAARRRIATALRVANECGGIDGDHHKTWVIDQMVRALAGRDYAAWVRAHRAGEDGPETYDWDEGIAP